MSMAVPGRLTSYHRQYDPADQGLAVHRPLLDRGYRRRPGGCLCPAFGIGEKIETVETEKVETGLTNHVILAKTPRR